MKGSVNEQGQARIDLTIRSSPTSGEITISAWIDTAFNGELVLPQTLIDQLGLTKSAEIGAGMADGIVRPLNVFSAWIPWFDEIKEVEVVASAGQTVLLGIGLMLGHELRVNYRTLDVTLECRLAM